LKGRIPDDKVLQNDVAFGPVRDSDSDGVPNDDVVDNEVVGGRRPTNGKLIQTKPEVVIARVSVSTQPVRTEPVTV
jgi:hypothetical protein